MKKILLLLYLIILCAGQALASQSCFIVKENGNVLKSEGDCAKRYSPASTFKIAISLMGYDSGILIDTTHPLLSFQKGYPDFLRVWKQDQTPTSWIKNSCVWYSQVLTKELGMEKFKSYVAKFNYGNMDLSGDKGKNNGLTNSWLSSSLEISPEEQTIFLQKLLSSKLFVSSKAYEMTKEILFIKALSGGWKLYGKTGTGKQFDTENLETNLQHGWFVGWIEKDGKIIIFVNHILDNKKQNSFSGLRAKDEAMDKLSYIINVMKK
jgi:beta-lactamase class D